MTSVDDDWNQALTGQALGDRTLRRLRTRNRDRATTYGQTQGIRSTALFSLATELPAAILARTLAIAIDVAVDWQHLTAGDWTGYAAEISRRAQTGTNQDRH